MVEKYGRRKCLGLGAAWMFMCFMVFASLGYFALEDENGNNRVSIGYVMIVFACLFIAAFASTWGPMVSPRSPVSIPIPSKEKKLTSPPQAWAVTSEIYPSRYRSTCIALCASAVSPTLFPGHTPCLHASAHSPSPTELGI
jgi:SP family sugar:H+ symporter-like MFS transporter